MGTEREAWLKERQNGIGASDAAAALGICPWTSRFKLWAEKTGNAEPPSLDDNERAYWGLKLEGEILQGYQEKSGRQVIPEPNYKIRRNPNHPWMTATLDATQFELPECGSDPRRRSGGAVDAKNVGYFPGKEWETEAPLHYQIQLQHQLAVGGFEWGTLTALIAGQKLIWYDMERNQNFIDAMIQKESEFWDLVQSNTAPDPDGSIATTDTLKRLYPVSDGRVICLPLGFEDLDQKLVGVKDSIKSLENDKRLFQNQIKAALGDATTGVLPGGGRYTFKSQTVNHKAAEAYASSHRVLRRTD